MRSYLDINSTVWNLIKKRFETEKITPNILDVGARNGIYILPNGYSENCNLIGFEPNKNEFEKLKTNKTPLQSKKREPKFFRKKYFNIALWKKKCRRNFYITIGEGASTLMGESNLKSDIYLFNEKKNYKDKHTKITNSYKINCDKLDNLYKNEVIDFLKLDTEGSELPILEGAIELLKKKKILMIKCEFVFFKYYKEHNIFGSIHEFLDKFGYRLISLDLDHPKYSPKRPEVPFINDRGLSYCGDAYFCIDFTNNELGTTNILRLSAISFALGFNNLGLTLLNQSNKFSKEEYELIKKSFKKVSFLRLLTNFWKRIPSLIFNLINK